MSRPHFLKLILVIILLGNTMVMGSTTRPIPSITPYKLTPTNDDHFDFIVQGDNRPPGPGKPLPGTIVQIINEIRMLNPPFVLSVGDLVWGYRDTKQTFLNELDRFQSIANRAGVPIFN